MVRLKKRKDIVDVSVGGKAVGYCVQASWGPVWFAYDLRGRTVQGPGGTGVHGGLHGAARAVVTKSARVALVANALRRAA